MLWIYLYKTIALISTRYLGEKAQEKKIKKRMRKVILVGLFWILKWLQNSKYYYCFLLILSDVVFVYFIYSLGFLVAIATTVLGREFLK